MVGSVGPEVRTRAAHAGKSVVALKATTLNNPLLTSDDKVRAVDSDVDNIAF